MLCGAFAKEMAAIGGFEARPHLAVGVSGGCDSLALLALAQEWATARGGRVSAVTVDHGLRAEAAAEAAQVGRLAAMWGVDHHCLSLDRKLEPANVMAAARAARYRVMEDWCRDRGILHLLLGHQRDDQAETLLLRLGRGSGLRGLAAMRTVEYRCHLRLLRPLLDIARADLARHCQTHGWPTLDDPSNRNLAYARSRLRQALPILAAEGMTAPRLSMTARHLARAAELVDGAVAMALARHGRGHPAGFGRLALGGWRGEAEETRLRALAQLLQWVGGGAYPPRFKRLQRLAAHLTQAQGRATLAGCQLIWRQGWLWIGREAADMALAQSVAPGESILWDGRFAVDMPANGPAGWKIGPLGSARPWRTAPETVIPRWLWPTLPAWRHLDVVAAVPHLNYSLMGDEAKGAGLPLLIYRPAVRLDDGFAVDTEHFRAQPFSSAT